MSDGRGRRSKFGTVRCIIHRGHEFLLVVHSNRERVNLGRWGLPGGRIERGESFEATARREIREELRISLGPLREVGDYRYKGRFHRVLAAEYDQQIVRFNRSEILEIRWHTLEEIERLSLADKLHAGFEESAIRDLLNLARSSAPARRGCR